MRSEASRWVLVLSVVAAHGLAPTDAWASPSAIIQVPPDSSEDAVGPADTTTVRGTDYVLEPITVTAERERATAPPVATITVSSTDLKLTQSDNPYDLIRRVAGLEVHDQGQGPGFASNVVLRGFTADHSSDLLLVVDGVPLNLPVHGHVEGYADWNYLFPGAISSLRVVHGPSSPLHGDFSIAGAVEVYTKADADRTEGAASANAFGDVSTWFTTGVRAERGGAMAGLDLRRVAGWKKQSARTVGNALLRGWRTVGEGRLEGGIALHGADWESPGFLSMSEFERGDLDLVANGTDGGKQARIATHARYARPLGGARYLEVMGWGVASDWDLYLTVPGHEDAVGSLYQTWESDRRWSVGGRAELSWLPRAGELTVGIAAREDGSEYDQSRALRRVAIEDFVALDAGHASASAYARWRWHAHERLGIDLGARVDHLRNRSLNRLGLETAQAQAIALQVTPDVTDLLYVARHPIENSGPVGEWVSGSQTLASPKLGMEFRISPRWSLLGSSSRGFRSAVGVVGDPGRPPVVAWAHEVGVEFAGPGVGAHLSLFRSDVTNERIQDPVTLEISSSGASVRQGIEATAEVNFNNGVRLFGRGTLTDARLSGRYADAHDDHGQGHEGEAESNAGQPVPGIARYIGQLSLEAPIWGELEGRLEWRRTGSYVPIGEPDARTRPFSTFDAAVRVPVSAWLMLELEGRNLFDATYAEMRSSGYVSPGAPRSLSLTMSVLDPPH